MRMAKIKKKDHSYVLGRIWRNSNWWYNHFGKQFDSFFRL